MAAEVAQSSDAGGLPSSPAIYRPVRPGDRLFQGEVLEGIVEWHARYDTTEIDKVVGIMGRPNKLVIVVTQDCDLEQDWSKRATDIRAATDLPCVLLCPAGPAEQFMNDQAITGDGRRKPIRNNKNERYQYLAEIPVDVDQTGSGHPALLVDFKSLFAVRTPEVYRQLRSTEAGAPRRRCRLETPWAEHLQSRFAVFHARIGLPKDHFVPENRRGDAIAPG